MKPYTKVAIQGLLPYLDDYIMGEHDPFVEDFHWSMDDNRHTESQSPELTEVDVAEPPPLCSEGCHQQSEVPGNQLIRAGRKERPSRL